MDETTPHLSDLVDLHYRVLQDSTRTSLDRLSSLTSLRVNLDDVAFTLVLDARSRGASWHEIGLRLGITKQAAHKRFGFGPSEIEEAASGARVHRVDTRGTGDHSSVAAKRLRASDADLFAVEVEEEGR